MRITARAITKYATSVRIYNAILSFSNLPMNKLQYRSQTVAHVKKIFMKTIMVKPVFTKDNNLSLANFTKRLHRHRCTKFSSERL